MIFAYGFTIFILFIAALFFPPIGLFIPTIKIKTMSKFPLNKVVIANIMIIVLILIFQYSFLILYLPFLIVELLYFFLKSRFLNLGVVDKINISSIVSSTILFGILLMVIKQSGVNFESMKEIYLTKTTVKIEEIEMVFNILKDNGYLLSFIYIYIMNAILYLKMESKSIKSWKLSYLWILPYLIMFFMKKMGILDGYIVENVMNISKVIFIFFGMICIYKNVNKKIKNTILSKLVVIIGVLLSSSVFFIYGVIKTLKNEEN